MSLVLGLVPQKAYKAYTAILTQSGTGQPTVTELENELGNITWNRSSEGQYFATSNNGSFKANKTISFTSMDGELRDPSAPTSVVAFSNRIDNSTLVVATWMYDSIWTVADINGQLVIRIEVYD